MCRLYGFHSNAATRVECSLVRAQNALLAQSRSDERGLANADGWGIASYRNGSPEVERCDQAAFSNLFFSEAAQGVYSKTVLAHIRRATVGNNSLGNTHPFSFGVWTMAHNGTVEGFSTLERELLDELPDYLRQERRGTTDSELVFLWLLGVLEAQGFDLERPAGSADALSQCIGDAITQLAIRSDRLSVKESSKLNILLTDGETLLASRWGNSLHRLLRVGVHDCEICGLCHIPDGRRGDYRALIIASEPISSEAWEEIPDKSLVGIDSELKVSWRSIGC